MKTLLVLLALVTLAVGACRSGPPPTSNSNTLAGRSANVANQYNGVIVIDPGCSSFNSKDDQVLCITNKGKDPVKIGKWLVRNTIGRTYYFPDSTTIDPGKSLKLHTDAGTNSPTDLYWNYEFKPVFDTKDQITLVDLSDENVSQITTP